MRFVRYIAWIMLSALSLAGCKKDNGFDDKLPEMMGGPCLVIRNSTVFRYTEEVCQESYMPTRRLYRAGTDTMSDFFSVKMSEVPVSEGQHITCSITWTDKNREKAVDRLSFEVQTISDGVVWLWCAGQQIAVAVRILN